MREEKKILTKYGEQKRTINDALFKDEVTLTLSNSQLQMIIVEVHRIKAIKKAILFLRFIETASMQITESKGDFDVLPPASQTSILNVAFSAQYLRIPEYSDFGGLIFQFFQNSLTFNKMFESWEGLDEELKQHCENIKLQRVSDKEIARFYIEYMTRHVLQADPSVSNKLAQNEYSDQIGKSYGSNAKVNEFISPAEKTRRKIAEEQMKQEQEALKNGRYAGYGANGQKQSPMSGSNNEWGQNQQNNHGWGQMPPPNFMQNQGFQGNFQNNFPNQQQMYSPQPYQSQGHNPIQYVSESQLPLNQQDKNSEIHPNPFGKMQNNENIRNHNDIFETVDNQRTNKQAQPPAFGGPADGKMNTGDQQFDQFLQDLDDLKKI